MSTESANLQLKNWFKTQDRFKNYDEIAKELEVDARTFGRWVQGVYNPSPEVLPRLYEITKLECYRPGSKLEDAPHKQLQRWFKNQKQFKSQTEAAKALGVSEKTFSRYLKGERHPPAMIKNKLYSLTGLEIYKGGAEKATSDEEIWGGEKPSLTKRIERIKDDMFDFAADVRELVKILEESPDIKSLLEKRVDGRNVEERVKTVGDLIYALADEMEFFKKGDAEVRKALTDGIDGGDVGYLTTLLRSLYDEDKFQKFIQYSTYQMKKKR